MSDDDDSDTDFSISLDYTNFSVSGFVLSTAFCIFGILCLKQFVSNRFARFGNRTSKSKQVAASPCKIHRKWILPSGYESRNPMVRIARFFGDSARFGDDAGNLYFGDLEWMCKNQNQELFLIRHKRYQILNFEAFDALDEEMVAKDSNNRHSEDDEFKVNNNDLSGRDDGAMNVMYYDPRELTNFMLKVEADHGENTWIPYVIACPGFMITSVFVGYFMGGTGTAFTGFMTAIVIMVGVEVFLRLREKKGIAAVQDANLTVQRSRSKHCALKHYSKFQFELQRSRTGPSS
jgi:hypothetical protein